MSTDPKLPGNSDTVLPEEEAPPRHEAHAGHGCMFDPYRKTGDARRSPAGTLVTCEHCATPHPKDDDGRACLFPRYAPTSRKDPRGELIATVIYDHAKQEVRVVRHIPAASAQGPSQPGPAPSVEPATEAPRPGEEDVVTSSESSEDEPPKRRTR